MNDYIYCLFEVDTGTKFYIGRTIDPHRRLNEHRLGSKNYQKGDELKYQYANALDQLGSKWDMEILMECGPGTDFYEDFFINKYRHEPLQNMRAGDSEPWMGRDYTSPEEFVQTRSLAIEMEKLRTKEVKPKVQRESNPDQMIFSFEKPQEKFVAPAFRELAKKVHKSHNLTKKR